MAFLNPSEVLDYLNELGYTNITQHQLKDFMIDLKKLMKHDTRRFEDVSPRNIYMERQSQQTRRDVFDDLYNAGTVASTAKTKQYKDNLITLQINRPRKVVSLEIVEKATLADSPKPSEDSTKLSEKISVGGSSSTICCSGSQPTTARTYTMSKGSKKADEEVLQKKTKAAKKPSKSFIRPQLNTRPPKSDPVALYHQYQELWKKQKFPGKDNHTNLRWTIREKMLGGDKFDYCF